MKLKKKHELKKIKKKYLAKMKLERSKKNFQNRLTFE